MASSLRITLLWMLSCTLCLNVEAISPPSDLRLAEVTTSSATVAFTSPPEGADRFEAVIIEDGEPSPPEYYDTTYASFDDLIPGKTYTVQIRSIVDGSEPSIPATLDITTTPATPYNLKISKFINPIMTQYRVTGSRTMMYPVYGAVVAWEQPGLGYFDDFVLKVDPPHGTVRVPITLKSGTPSQQPTQQRRIVWDVLPGVLYSFTIQSKSNGVAGVPVTGRERMPPEQPGPITVEETGPTHALISWDDEHRGILDGYSVETDPLGGVAEQVHEDPAHKRRKVTNLTPGTKYKMEVYSTMENLLSFKPRVVELATHPATPKGPVVIQEITTESTLVSWYPPPGQVDYYEVVYYPSDRDFGRLRERVWEPSANLTVLDPGSSYVVEIFAVSNDIHGIPLKDTVYTLPLPPNNVITTSTHDTILISWETVYYDGGGKVVYYPEGDETSTTTIELDPGNTELSITTLDPSTNYVIKVFNVKNEVESDPVITTMKTHAEVTKAPPSDNPITPKTAATEETSTTPTTTSTTTTTTPATTTTSTTTTTSPAPTTTEQYEALVEESTTAETVETTARTTTPPATVEPGTIERQQTETTSSSTTGATTSTATTSQQPETPKKAVTDSPTTTATTVATEKSSVATTAPGQRSEATSESSTGEVRKEEATSTTSAATATTVTSSNTQPAKATAKPEEVQTRATEAASQKPTPAGNSPNETKSPTTTTEATQTTTKQDQTTTEESDEGTTFIPLSLFPDEPESPDNLGDSLYDPPTTAETKKEFITQADTTQNLARSQNIVSEKEYDNNRGKDVMKILKEKKHFANKASMSHKKAIEVREIVSSDGTEELPVDNLREPVAKSGQVLGVPERSPWEVNTIGLGSTLPPHLSVPNMIFGKSVKPFPVTLYFPGRTTTDPLVAPTMPPSLPTRLLPFTPLTSVPSEKPNLPMTTHTNPGPIWPTLPPTTTTKRTTALPSWLGRHTTDPKIASRITPESTQPRLTMKPTTDLVAPNRLTSSPTQPTIPMASAQGTVATRTTSEAPFYKTTGFRTSRRTDASTGVSERSTTPGGRTYRPTWISTAKTTWIPTTAPPSTRVTTKIRWVATTGDSWVPTTTAQTSPNRVTSSATRANWIPTTKDFWVPTTTAQNGPSRVTSSTTRATWIPTTKAPWVPTTTAQTSPSGATRATWIPTTKASWVPTTTAQTITSRVTSSVTRATWIPTTKASWVPTTSTSRVTSSATKATWIPTTKASWVPTTTAQTSPSRVTSSATRATWIPTTKASWIPTTEVPMTPTTKLTFVRPLTTIATTKLSWKPTTTLLSVISRIVESTAGRPTFSETTPTTTIDKSSVVPSKPSTTDRETTWDTTTVPSTAASHVPTGTTDAVVRSTTSASVSNITRPDATRTLQSSSQQPDQTTPTVQSLRTTAENTGKKIFAINVTVTSAAPTQFTTKFWPDGRGINVTPRPKTTTTSVARTPDGTVETSASTTNTTMPTKVASTASGAKATTGPTNAPRQFLFTLFTPNNGTTTNTATTKQSRAVIRTTSTFNTKKTDLNGTTSEYYKGSTVGETPLYFTTTHATISKKTDETGMTVTKQSGNSTQATGGPIEATSNMTTVAKSPSQDWTTSRGIGDTATNNSQASTTTPGYLSQTTSDLVEPDRLLVLPYTTGSPGVTTGKKRLNEETTTIFSTGRPESTSVPASNKVTHSVEWPTTVDETEDIVVTHNRETVTIREGFKTICEPNNITVLVDKAVIGQYEDRFGPLHMNADEEDQSCKGVEYERYFRYTIAPNILGCGTQIEVNDTHVNFTNTVSNRRQHDAWYKGMLDDTGTILVGRHNMKPFPLVHMNIYCTFPIEMTVHTDLIPDLRLEVKTFNVSGKGQFSAIMQLFRDEEYSQPYFGAPFLAPDDTLRVGVTLLETKDENISIAVRKCWATPMPQFDFEEYYPLIDDYCPLAEALKGNVDILENGKSKRSRWEGPVFRFVTYDEVWLHCELKVCFDRSCNKTCDVKDLPRSKRSLLPPGWEPSGRGGAVVSAGPVFPKPGGQQSTTTLVSDTKTSDSEGALNETTVLIIIIVLCTVIFLSCVLFVLLVTVCRRRFLRRGREAAKQVQETSPVLPESATSTLSGYHDSDRFNWQPDVEHAAKVQTAPVASTGLPPVPNLENGGFPETFRVVEEGSTQAREYAGLESDAHAQRKMSSDSCYRNPAFDNSGESR